MRTKSKNIISPLYLGLGFILTVLSPAIAIDNFDNQTIEFDEDTSVEFEFVAMVILV